jgi:hypothetical protein
MPVKSIISIKYINMLDIICTFNDNSMVTYKRLAVKESTFKLILDVKKIILEDYIDHLDGLYITEDYIIKTICMKFINLKRINYFSDKDV